MGALTSRDVDLQTSVAPSKGRVLKSQVVDVLLNGVAYNRVECTLMEHMLRLHIGRVQWLCVLLKDVISVSFTNHEKSTAQCVYMEVYPVTNERRVSLSVHLCFVNNGVACSWYALLRTALSTPCPPHLNGCGVVRERRRILVIVNPFSGQKKALQLWKEETEPVFKQAALDYDVVLTKRVRHATQLASRVPLDEYDAVAVVSGDGVVLEVIEGLLMRCDRDRALRLPIAHIPGGTSNALAAAICFQCNEPFQSRGVFCVECALMVARPRYLPLRICHVQTHDGHQAMFMSVTWGLVADIDIASERFRWAGMARLHMEAFLRIAQLPTVARYKARVSYLPITDPVLLRATKLRHVVDRKCFGKDHFQYDMFSQQHTTQHSTQDMAQVLDSADITEMPCLDQPVPQQWVTLEGCFVFACAVNISHLGSDLPYVPSSRLDEPVLYLTLCDWNTVTSRVQVGRMMLSIDSSHHLDYPCLQIIPVRACRIEPLDGCGGQIAVDGEPITPGTPFQVVSSHLCATVIGRDQPTTISIMVHNVFATSVTSNNCSRHELLAFVNDCLQANFTRIEEMASGAAYCQLTDLLFDSSIQLKKVKWNSKSEVDWIANWRLLQTAWKQLGVEKAVPVERLLKGKFQDNFEFLQWFKKLFDANCSDVEYRPVEARNGEPLPATVQTGRSMGRVVKKVIAVPSNATHPQPTALQSERDKTKQLQIELHTANEAVLAIEKERNFYFSKLQTVEELCQTAPTVSSEKILEVLYEVEEGFAAPPLQDNTQTDTACVLDQSDTF